MVNFGREEVGVYFRCVGTPDHSSIVPARISKRCGRLDISCCWFRWWPEKYTHFITRLSTLLSVIQTTTKPTLLCILTVPSLHLLFMRLVFTSLTQKEQESREIFQPHVCYSGFQRTEQSIKFNRNLIETHNVYARQGTFTSVLIPNRINSTGKECVDRDTADDIELLPEIRLEVTLFLSLSYSWQWILH